MKHAPHSYQHHDLYRKYKAQDSEISGLLGECGIYKDLPETEKKKAVFSTGSEEQLFHQTIHESVKRFPVMLKQDGSKVANQDTITHEIWSKLTFNQRKFYRLICEAELHISDGEYKAARRKLREALKTYDLPLVRGRLPATNKFRLIRLLSFSKPIDLRSILVIFNIEKV